MYDFNESNNDIVSLLEAIHNRYYIDLEFLANRISKYSKLYFINYFNTHFHVTKKIQYISASKDGNMIWIYGYDSIPVLNMVGDVAVWFHDGYQKKLMEVPIGTSLYKVLSTIDPDNTLIKVSFGDEEYGN